MSKSRTLLVMLDETTETVEGIKALATVNWDETRATLDRRAEAHDRENGIPTRKASNEIHSLNKKNNSLKNADKNNISRIVCLGHSDKKTYGDFDSAAKFVESLLKNYDVNRLNKVNDLYLVGCEVGAITSNNKSLAQSITDLLATKGVKNLRVHAVSQTLQNHKDQLTVKVIDKQGLELFQLGYINASINNNEIIATQHPAVVMDAEQNIFIANESLDARKNRLAADSIKRSEEEVLNKIIGRLQTRIRKKAAKKQTDDRKADIAYLNNVINQLCNSNPEQWRGILTKAYHEKKSLIGDLSGEGNTGDDLQACIKYCDAIKPVRVRANSTSMISTQLMSSESDSSEDEFEAKVVKPRYSINHSALNAPLLGNENPNPDFARFMDDLKKTKTALTNEISSIQHSCFAFFRSSTITLKETKLKAIQDMEKSKNLVELYNKASQYKEDKKVMQGWFSRTKKHINDILQVELPRTAVGLQQY